MTIKCLANTGFSQNWFIMYKVWVLTAIEALESEWSGNYSHTCVKFKVHGSKIWPATSLYVACKSVPRQLNYRQELYILEAYIDHNTLQFSCVPQWHQPTGCQQLKISHFLQQCYGHITYLEKKNALENKKRVYLFKNGNCLHLYSALQL